jgi:hypothetical protein
MMIRIPTTSPKKHYLTEPSPAAMSSKNSYRMQNGLRRGLRSCNLKLNTKQPPLLLPRNAKPFHGEKPTKITSSTADLSATRASAICLVKRTHCSSTTSCTALENLPGISIFKRDADNQVYRTYSVFGSALLELVQYNFMFDLTPEGRPEGAPEMSFLKHKDAYQFPGRVF